MNDRTNAGGGSAADDRSAREHSAALLRTLAEHGAWESDADFLREIVRGLADAIAQPNADDETRALVQLAHRARRELLAVVGHDLLTPLNGILGYAQLLAHDPALHPRQSDAVKKVRECGEQLLALVNAALDRDDPGDRQAPVVRRLDERGTSADPPTAEGTLPAAVRSRLFEPANRGDIVELNRCLDELERQGQHPRLVDELRAHARAFDMRAIRDRLERTRGTA